MMLSTGPIVHAEINCVPVVTSVAEQCREQLDFTKISSGAEMPQAISHGAC